MERRRQPKPTNRQQVNRRLEDDQSRLAQPAQSDVRIPPYSAKIEQALVAGLMQFPEFLPDVRLLLGDGEPFYLEAMRLIYGAICRVADANRTIRPGTVIAELARQQQESVLQTYPLDNIYAWGQLVGLHVSDAASVIRDQYLQRQIIVAASECQNQAYEGSLDQTLEAAGRLTELATSGTAAGVTVKQDESVRQMLAELDKAMSHEGPTVGVPTGCKKLDRFTGGIGDGDFVLGAARPAVGKTILVMASAMDTAELGIPVAVVNLEMPHAALTRRLISRQCGIPYKWMRMGRDEYGNKLTNDQVRDIHKAAGKLEKLPIHYYRGPNDLDDICRWFTTMSRRHGTKLHVVDFLQRCETRRRYNGDVEKVSVISQGLKDNIQTIGTPIFAACQLSRAVEAPTRTDKHPELGDLRGSGSLEQDATMVLGLYREDYYMLKQWEKDNPEAKKMGLQFDPSLFTYSWDIEILKGRDAGTTRVSGWVDVATMRNADTMPDEFRASLPPPRTPAEPARMPGYPPANTTVKQRGNTTVVTLHKDPPPPQQLYPNGFRTGERDDLGGFDRQHNEPKFQF